MNIIRNKWEKFPRRQGGAEIVEMVLTIGYFLALVFTIIEGVRLIYTYTVTNFLAREAVRYAVVRGHRAGQDGPYEPVDRGDIESFVRDRGLLAPAEEVQVQACWNNAGPSCPDSEVLLVDDPNPDLDIYNNSTGQVVRVTVSYTFDSVVPHILWFDPSVPVSTAAQAVIMY